MLLYETLACIINEKLFKKSYKNNKLKISDKT